MKPSAEQARALQHLRERFLDIDMPSLLSSSAAASAPSGRTDDPELIRTRHSLLRFLCLGEPVEYCEGHRIFPDEAIGVLEQVGILQRTGEFLTLGEYRLVYHLGLFLFCHRISAQAKFYYGTDSLALSRVLSPVTGTVLDLCAGVGAQSLFCARTASRVTAVEIEPLAEPIFWTNSAMNGLSENIEFLSGDLFAPVRERKFDRICANPPFLPVPPKVRFPLYAGGGGDGLEIVRRLLEGLPDHLSADGECQIIASALGNSRGPNLSSLDDLPVTANLRIHVSCYTYEELSQRTLSLFAATALECNGSGDASDEYRKHFRELDATHLYYFVLRACFA
jgi:release factor glutamine methyltransferase